ncbi:MAG: LamG domain-containing protein [Armatimonadetes bacterium]|nr:LamG domain-containing protein [Armatimonadota bacterium]
MTNGDFLRGLIDEVRVSAKVLKPEEFGPHGP